ncbi:MAG: apolipoprotein N-acyltransferase [Rickettsiales bacterium]|nr:apolipoprotein N-acyltransferase [Rickettsiales bacterium]
MPVIINVKDKRWNAHKIDWARIAENALILENKGSEVSITLTNDRELRALNKKWRGIDSSTNVLSFESGDKELLGDIFISFDTAEREAPDDFANHAAHLITHGVLHLQGFDHIENRAAAAMEKKEAALLKKLGIKNPYGENRWRKILTAIGLFALGWLGVYGFAPHHFWIATAVSIGAAYYLLRDRRGGFWWGAGYGTAGFHWCLESIFANDNIAAAMWHFYPIGLIGIAAASGFIFGLPFWMTNKTGATGARRVADFALAWTFVLWLREWALTGFPWNPVANIVIESAAVAGLMSIVGALGLTFIIVAAICSIPEFARTRAKWPFLFFAPLLLAPLWNPRVIFDNGELVRIVQPGTDMNQKFDKAHIDANIANLVEMSKDSGADFVVWPETAYLGSGAALPKIGAKLITGAFFAAAEKLFNGMLVGDAAGRITGVYAKHHLVPFGEYSPLGIMPSMGNLAAGPGPIVIDDFVPAICYEIIFSDSLVPTGAAPHYIINITNDAWFGTSGGPAQHLDMARRQAIETGLPVVRANQAGISAIIDARGRVLDSIPLGGRGFIDARVPAAIAAPYRRLGLNGAMLLIVVISAAIIFCTRKKDQD